MTETSAEPDEHQRALRESEATLATHPAVREFHDVLALRRILDVWHLNWGELTRLLEAVATTEQLGMELVQNLRAPLVRDATHQVTTQRLHNYVAGTMSVVDHVRRLMKGRSGTTADEYERRRVEVTADNIIPFVQDLRNFILHRTVPGFAARVSLGDGEQQPAMRTELGLDRSQLLEWGGWKARSRAFLSGQADLLELRPIIARHGQLIGGLNGWLLTRLAKDNEPGLQEANILVAERNRLLMGTDDADAAKRLTQLWTELPGESGSLSIDDLMARIKEAISGGEAPGATHHAAGAPPE